MRSENPKALISYCDYEMIQAAQKFDPRAYHLLYDRWPYTKQRSVQKRKLHEQGKPEKTYEAIIQVYYLFSENGTLLFEIGSFSKNEPMEVIVYGNDHRQKVANRQQIEVLLRRYQIEIEQERESIITFSRSLSAVLQLDQNISGEKPKITTPQADKQSPH